MLTLRVARERMHAMDGGSADEKPWRWSGFLQTVQTDPD